MRVIAGTNRGTKLLSLEGLETRPTLDRIKETMFNIINEYIQDCYFLDLFSGSGAIGIEALSRGARKVVFVENSKQAIDVIKTNLKKTRQLDNAVVKNCDSFLYISSCDEVFDVIFLDPPYQKYDIKALLHQIISQKIISKHGIIVIEQQSDSEINLVDTLEIIKVKKFKHTNIIIMKYGGAL